MEMKYCMECGERLVMRPHREGGQVPWCGKCGAYRHPVFSTAVIMIVMDPSRERVILIQQYGRGKNILVAGYVDQGEAAEDTVRRELREELGLEAAEVRYNRSEYLPRTNTLMLNFTVIAADGDVVPNGEIDAWDWYSRAEAREAILQGSMAARFLNEYLDRLEAEEIT